MAASTGPRTSAMNSISAAATPTAARPVMIVRRFRDGSTPRTASGTHTGRTNAIAR